MFVNLAEVTQALGMDLSPATIDRLFIASEIQFPSWAFSFAVGMTAAWLFVELRRRHKADRLLRPARIALLFAGVALAVFIYLAGDISRNAPFLLAHEYARHSPFMALGFSLSLGTEGKPWWVTDQVDGPNGITSKPLDWKPNRTVEMQNH